MKRFSFPLERVLQWRRTQVQLAEAQIEKLRSQLAALHSQQSELDEAVRQAGKSVVDAAYANRVELAALERYRTAASRQLAAWANTRSRIEHDVARQLQVVLERQREVRLIEKLRERKWHQWRHEETREIEQWASESYLAGLTRRAAAPASGSPTRKAHPPASIG